MYYCVGQIRYWQPPSNLLETWRGTQSPVGEVEGGGYGQESIYAQSIPMATRRHSNSLSHLAPRLGHSGNLLFQSAMGVGAPGTSGGFFYFRRLGSLVLAYVAGHLDPCGTLSRCGGLVQQ